MANPKHQPGGAGMAPSLLTKENVTGDPGKQSCRCTNATGPASQRPGRGAPHSEGPVPLRESGDRTEASATGSEGGGPVPSPPAWMAQNSDKGQRSGSFGDGRSKPPARWHSPPDLEVPQVLGPGEGEKVSHCRGTPQVRGFQSEHQAM